MSRSTLVKDTVRRLQRRWPTAVTLKRVVRGTINAVTGSQDVTTTEYKVKRAILLPRNDVNKFVYDLAYLSSATSQMTQGGHFDSSLRFIIIAGKDLPVEPLVEDVLSIEGEEDAKVLKVMDMDQGAGWIIQVKAVKGVTNAVA